MNRTPWIPRSASRLRPLPNALAVLALVGCAETPAEPPGPPAPATVSVTSPIDSLVAVRRTVRLTALVADAEGKAIPGAAVSWGSSNAAVATVDATGLVTGVAAGPVVITATSGAKSGSLAMRVVAADLAGVATLLNDPFLAALVANLEPPAAAVLSQTVQDLKTATTAGHLSAMGSHLTSAQAVVTGPGSGTNRVLFGVLALYVTHAVRLLNL